MTFGRYGAYKDSGVAGLGNIPKHWAQTRFRFVAHLNPSKSEVAGLPGDTLVTFLPMEAIGEQGEVDTSRERPLEEVLTGYTYLREGDVAYAKITPCFENGKGALFTGLTNGIAFGTTELTIARPRPGLSTGRFLHWFFSSAHFRRRAEAAMYGAGGQKRVPDDFVRDFEVALPPLPEQQAIATFLDRETARIDTLIAEQQRLIALLTEKRQAVISHAVTKGLDPTVPMKDSGVAWLGEVPGHWMVGRVKNASSFITSGPRGWSDHLGDNGSLFIQSGDLGESLDVNFENAKRVEPQGDAEAARTRLQSGDVLVCITGAKTGNVAVCDDLPEPAYINQHLALIRINQNAAFSYYVGAFLKGGPGQDYFSIAQYGLKQGLSLDNVSNAPLLLPPLEEQMRITSFIRGQSIQLSALVRDAALTITLLQERRTALITAAVTGQIDVRAYAAALPA